MPNSPRRPAARSPGARQPGPAKSRGSSGGGRGTAASGGRGATKPGTGGASTRPDVAAKAARSASLPKAESRTTAATAAAKAGLAKSARSGSGGSPAGRASPPGRASLTGRAAILALVIGVLILSYAYPLRTWFEQRSRLVALEEEHASLDAQIEALEAHQQQLRDPAYVKAQARERLNFVMPGEIGFIVTEPEEVSAAAPLGPSVAPAAGTGPWWQRLWASVEAADAASDGIAPGTRSATRDAQDSGPPNGAAEDLPGAESGGADPAQGAG